MALLLFQYGLTALAYAGRSGHTETVKLLLSHPDIDEFSNSMIATKAAGTGWVAQRLKESGLSARLIAECNDILINHEGFMSETNFAELSVSKLTSAYLDGIGIASKDAQLHIKKLHALLRA